VNSELPPADNFTEAFYERRAWLAFTILGVNLLLFLLMAKSSLLPLRWTLISGSDHATLINFGAKTNFWLVQQRQWFRLVTPIFLHIGIFHLAMNAYALCIVGPVVERLYGSARFALLYLLTGMAGVAGSLFSVRLSKFDGPTAGSSGALFGLFGALLVVSYKYRHELPTDFRRAFSKGVLFVVCINLAFGFLNNFGRSLCIRWSLHFVDNWAHIAGLLMGAILAMILPSLATKKKQDSKLEKTLLIFSIFIVSVCFLRAYQLRPFHW
jgi:rhomboid protease GluP